MEIADDGVDLNDDVLGNLGLYGLSFDHLYEGDALFFNPKHEMPRRVRICRGEVSENAADPRNIMRFGVLTLRDHIILAEERYFSFKENKKL